MRSAHPGPSWPSLNVQSHPLLPPRMWVYSPKLWHIQIMKRTAHNKGWTMWAYSIYCKAECKMLIKVYQWKRDHLDCKWHCPGSPYPWTCLSWPVPTYGAWAKKISSSSSPRRSGCPHMQALIVNHRIFTIRPCSTNFSCSDIYMILFNKTRHTPLKINGKHAIKKINVFRRWQIHIPRPPFL